MSVIGHDPVLSLVVFSIAGQRYALNLPVVERVLRMVEVSPLPKAPLIVLGVINFHGEIIPAIDIRRRFGHSPSHYGVTSSLLVARGQQYLGNPRGLQSYRQCVEIHAHQ